MKYFVKWRNADALNCIDVIEGDWLTLPTFNVDLVHSTIVPDEKPVLAEFHIEHGPEDSLLFCYGGRHTKVNEERDVFIGDWRIFPKEFPGATETSWREPSGDWKPFFIVVKYSFPEGNRREGHRNFLTRKSQLRHLLLDDAEAKSALKCEACGFRGHKAYGHDLKQCFEVHHRLHIAEGVRNTTSDQLAILCANCHNVLHCMGDLPVEALTSRFQ